MVTIEGPKENRVLLSGRNLCKEYGFTVKQTALNGVDIALAEGECVAVVGRNGAGKTTLLKILAGVMPHTSGTVTRNCTVSFMPEGLGSFHDLSAYDAIEYFLQLSETKTLSVREIISLLKLPHSRKKQIRDYSKGMKRKVMLGMMIASDPLIYILDEPFDGLDPIASRDIIGFIDTVRKSGRSVILSSHDLTHVGKVANRIVYMKNGQLDEKFSKRGDSAIVVRFTSPLENVKSVLDSMHIEYSKDRFPVVEIRTAVPVDEIVSSLSSSGLMFDEVRTKTLYELFEEGFEWER